MGTLSSGASKLNGGLESVGTAVSALHDGSSKINTGISTFADQADSLVSGASTLSDATGQLNTGISTLSDKVSSMVGNVTKQLTEDTEASSETSETAEAPIHILINQGRNITVSSVLDSMITKIFAETGLDFETEYINPVSAGFNATYFGTCVFIFVYIVSYASGVILTRIHPIKVLSGERKTKPALIQLIYALGLSICAGLLITGIISLISTMDLPVMNTAVFLSIATFALIILVTGSIDLFGMAGMAIPILMLVLGIGTANMPYEFLPEFWQNYIYPWMPLQIISNGIKQVVYTGAGWWNDLTGDLIIVVAAGLILLAISALKPDKKAISS